MSRVDARSRRRRLQHPNSHRDDGLLGADLDFDSRFTEWVGMPEYLMRDEQFYRALEVKFPTLEDMSRFQALVGHKRARFWFSDNGARTRVRYRTLAGRLDTPDAPVYVPSKGRWQDDRRLTSLTLERLGVPHFIIVEQSEAKAYRESAGPAANIIVLDPVYQRYYDPCDELGQSKSLGPGPARNFAWDHAISNGYVWHWVMDDNIRGFLRMNRNRKDPVVDGAMFRAMEAFVQRYENVAMAGPAYDSLIRPRNIWPPFVTNTRIYSCNLVRADERFRWRGRYNEDTILSIDMMKAGSVTVQFNAFLQQKAATQTVKGGNTDEFYAQEGTLEKSRMLARVHPDVAMVGERYGRWHHYVNYPALKTNALSRRQDVDITDGVDDFGMVREIFDEVSGAWSAADRPIEEEET